MMVDCRDILNEKDFLNRSIHEIEYQLDSTDPTWGGTETRLGGELRPDLKHLSTFPIQ
jgi:hypothetical protein